MNRLSFKVLAPAAALAAVAGGAVWAGFGSPSLVEAQPSAPGHGAAHRLAVSQAQNESLHRAVTALTERLSSVERALNDRTSSAGPASPAMTRAPAQPARARSDVEEQLHQQQGAMATLEAFAQRPVDEAWRSSAEGSFYANAARAHGMLASLGVSIEGVQCRSGACRVDVRGDAEQHGVVLAMFPWDSSSQFVPDPTDPTRGSYIVERVEPLKKRR